MNNGFSYCIKYHRKVNGLTQADLAKKAGVGLRFVRDVEQGKESIIIGKLSQVLQVFGLSVSIRKSDEVDPYEVLMKYSGDTVVIKLKNRTTVQCVILEPKWDNRSVRSWIVRYVEDYKEINHSDIVSVQSMSMNSVNLS